MTSHTIDDRTIEACQRGDSEAFRLVFQGYKDRVYSIALCFFDGNEATAKDVTQEVFLKLMTTLMGRTPPDSHAWIIHETVPAFVRFEGPLSADGPVWRIETTAPRWPENGR